MRKIVLGSIVMAVAAVVLILATSQLVQANQFGHGQRSPASPVGEAMQRNRARDVVRDERRGVNTLDSQQGQRADNPDGDAGLGGESGAPTAIIKFEPVSPDFWNTVPVPEGRFRSVPPTYNEIPWEE